MSSLPPTSSEAFYARTFAVLVLVGLGMLLYLILQPVFVPLAWAGFLAFLLYPLHMRLVLALRGRDNVSAALLTILAVVLILGPLSGLTAAFVAQANEVVELGQKFAQQQRQPGATAPGWLQSALAWLWETVGISPEQLREWAVEAAKTLLQSLAGMGGRIFVGALGTVIGFTVTIFALFFLLRDGAQMLATARGLIPMPDLNKQRLFDHLGSVTMALIYGIGVTALVQGALLGIGFAVLGLPAPVVVGVFGALFALLPLLGTPLIWVPAAIILAAQGRWIAAVVLLLWGLGVSTVDNVLRPILVSERAHISTLTVFIGVIGGVSAFGTLGLFLGPLLLSLALALARFALEMRHRHTSS